MRHSQQAKAKAIAACQGLLAALPGQVFLRNSDSWTVASTATWSQTCALSPECVFAPDGVSEISMGIKIIKEYGSRFAVRGGGYMAVPGAQSIDEGVMISMSNFQQRTLTPDRSIASIGPGQLWSEVYSWLVEYGLAVNGGRFPMVGVGGVLLGGGMGYFAGQRGWSIDDLVGWEVILADGQIVNVTASSDDPCSDLAWALRGGHNHFGIVTRFDIRTFAVGPVFGGLVLYDGGAEEQFFSALDSYMAIGGGSDNPLSAINPVSTLQLVDGAWKKGFLNVYMYAERDESPEALKNFTNIPTEQVNFSTTALHDNWVSVPNSLADMATKDSRTLFWAISFKADRRAIDTVSQIFYAGATNELNHVEGLAMMISFQPLTVPYLMSSKANGGNMMGLDPQKDARHFAGILFPIWKLPQDDEAVLTFTRNAARVIEEKLSSLGLFNPYVYLNDAAPGQRPFESYAGGAHLERLRKTQVKYDPDGFFKDYLQHGFELGSRISSGRDHEDL